MDIVAVLDRSGSMSGEKMGMLHETVRLMVEHLKAEDRLCLVSYESSVRTDLPLTKMDKAGKDLARLALAQIRASGGTNLSGGLLAGLQVLKNRGEGKNEVSSVLLMTDGQANAGITSPPELTAETQRFLATMNNPTSIYTFGFGAGHNSELLSSLADAAHGTYYFLKTADVIPTAFADCLGGLMSVVAQNIRLRLTVCDGVRINSVITAFTVNELEAGREYVVDMGDLFGEEERDVLLDVTLPAVPAATDAHSLVTAELKYLNVVTAGSDVQTATVAVPRTADGTALGAVSTKVDQERNRTRTAAAMDQAQQLANANKLTEAQAVLTSCMQHIQASPSAAACEPLVRDVQSVHQRMRTQEEYRSEGQHRLLNKSKKHKMQRACESDWKEEQSYATSSKMANRALWGGK